MNANIPTPQTRPVDPDLLVFRSVVDDEPRIISSTDSFAGDEDVTMERLVEARAIIGAEIERRLKAQGVLGSPF